jgi:hypothetical protein
MQILDISFSLYIESFFGFVFVFQTENLTIKKPTKVRDELKKGKKRYLQFKNKIKSFTPILVVNSKQYSSILPVPGLIISVPAYRSHFLKIKE